MEKLVAYSKTIPGFSNISKSTARKFLNQFTLMKVKKGWKMQQSEKEKKMYMIISGNFVFQGFNT